MGRQSLACQYGALDPTQG